MRTVSSKRDCLFQLNRCCKTVKLYACYYDLSICAVCLVTILHDQGLRSKICYVPALTAIKRITVNMPPELHMELKLHAVAADTTINQCVVAAIKSHLRYKCNAVDVAPDKANT